MCITMGAVSLTFMVIRGIVYYFAQSEPELQNIGMMNSIALPHYRTSTPAEPDFEIMVKASYMLKQAKKTIIPIRGVSELRSYSANYPNYPNTNKKRLLKFPDTSFN